MYRAMDVTLNCYTEKPIAKACIIVIDFGFGLNIKTIHSSLNEGFLKLKVLYCLMPSSFEGKCFRLCFTL